MVSKEWGRPKQNFISLRAVQIRGQLSLVLMPCPLLIDPAIIATRTSLNSALRWLVDLKHVICPSLGLSFSLCQTGPMIPDAAAWR